MADVHSKETRSYNMSQIKGKNTKPEMLVRKFLFANRFRYRLHDKKLPGKPDIVLYFDHNYSGRLWPLVCRYLITDLYLLLPVTFCLLPLALAQIGCLHSNTHRPYLSLSQ